MNKTDDEPEARWQEKARAREARYAARAVLAAEKAQGTSLERAKLAALQAVAAKQPGGSLPDFLEKVSLKMGAKFTRPADRPEPPPPPSDVVIATTLSIYRPSIPFRGSHGGGGPIHQALQVADTLGTLVTLAGLRAFRTLALVCHAWRDAVMDKAQEWGVLSYVKAIGGGYGKRKAQLDTPTWLCALPIRDNLLNLDAAPTLCVLDSCNYRLSFMRFDGTVSRTLARVGIESSDTAHLGEVSQPSSLCFDVGSSSAYVVAIVGSSDRRLFRYALPHFTLMGASDAGHGASLLDAPEGMAVSNNMVFVVDTARHRLATFDAVTLAFLGHSGGYSDRRTRWHHRSGEPIFTSPYDVVAHEEELFVSDTHNDRIQVLTASHPARWLGVIGQSGHGPGQFTYPRGLAIARDLLYVCEERQVQVLTTNGEPRMILPIHAASGLCGICTDGVRSSSRVFVTDMDLHKIHVLRLTHDRRAMAAGAARDAEREAKLRDQLRRGAGAVGADDPNPPGVGGGETEDPNKVLHEQNAEEERKAKTSQRDRLLQRVSTSPPHAGLHRVLGLPHHADRPEAMQAVRLALRLLHPDRGMNLPLKGTVKGKALEAAFKRVNNLKDNL